MLENDTSGYDLFKNNIEWQKGNYAACLEAFQKEYAQDSSLTATRSLFELNCIVGNNQEAYKYASKMIDQWDNKIPVWFYRIHWIGYAYWQVGKIEEAGDFFDQQIIKYLENIRLGNYSIGWNPHLELAKIYAFLEDREKAYQYLEEFSIQRYFTLSATKDLKDSFWFKSIREEERIKNIQLQIESKYQNKRERISVWLDENDML